jgi:hypothetical protein
MATKPKATTTPDPTAPDPNAPATPPDPNAPAPDEAPGPDEAPADSAGDVTTVVSGAVTVTEPEQRVDPNTYPDADNIARNP